MIQRLGLYISSLLVAFPLDSAAGAERGRQRDWRDKKRLLPPYFACCSGNNSPATAFHPVSVWLQTPASFSAPDSNLITPIMSYQLQVLRTPASSLCSPNLRGVTLLKLLLSSLRFLFGLSASDSCLNTSPY